VDGVAGNSRPDQTITVNSSMTPTTPTMHFARTLQCCTKVYSKFHFQLHSSIILLFSVSANFSYTLEATCISCKNVVTYDIIKYFSLKKLLTCGTRYHPWLSKRRLTKTFCMILKHHSWELDVEVITFRVSRRRREMYCGHARLCVSVCVCPSVCLSVRGCMPTHYDSSGPASSHIARPPRYVVSV